MCSSWFWCRTSLIYLHVFCRLQNFKWWRFRKKNELSQVTAEVSYKILSLKLQHFFVLKFYRKIDLCRKILTLFLILEPLWTTRLSILKMRFFYSFQSVLAMRVYTHFISFCLNEIYLLYSIFERKIQVNRK